MCTQVFLAADRTLPLLPLAPQAVLHVQRVQGQTPSERGLLRLLGRRHVYRAGSHLRCGCGFSYVDEFTRRADLQAYVRASRASVRALREYLAAAVGDGPVDVLVTALDHEDAEPATRCTITAAYFDPDSDEFVLQEGTLLTVTTDTGG
jgi:hypothetical protein